MKLFRKLFKRNYPKNKIGTDNDPVDVYAGPEPDEPCEPDEPGEPVAAERPDPERIRKPVFGHVYAGPKRKKNNRRQRFEAVYAGPPQMDSRPKQPINLLYAGPEKIDRLEDVKLLVLCGECGEENEADAETCKNCGAKLK